MVMARYAHQSALGRFGRPKAPFKRNFSSSTHHDVAYEAEKWEKITYLGIGICTVLSIYNLSKPHPHHEPPPQFPHLHIRHKDFPWGPDGLL